jgi:hypothetical protein
MKVEMQIDQKLFILNCVFCLSGYTIYSTSFRVSKITTTKAMGSEGDGSGEGDESEREGAEGDDQVEDKDKGEGTKSEKTGGKQSERGWGCIVS